MPRRSDTPTPDSRIAQTGSSRLGPLGLVDPSAHNLSVCEARALTEAINATSEMLHVLIARAKGGRAWLALGYRSFAEYVDGEFNISRSRAYQVLDQHAVITAIADAVPEGAHVPPITEAAARDLKHVLDDVVTAIRDRTAEGDAQRTADIVAETIREYRDKRRAIGPARMDDGRVIDLRVTMSLYSALQSLSMLPDPQAVRTAVPPERSAQITEHLRSAIAWLTDFERTWSEAEDRP